MARFGAQNWVRMADYASKLTLQWIRLSDQPHGSNLAYKQALCHSSSPQDQTG